MDSRVKGIIKEQQLRPGKTYIRSQFVIRVGNEHSSLLFNTLTKQILFSQAEDREYSAEEVSKDPGLLELMKAYFLVPSDKDEISFYLGIRNILHTLDKTNGINVFTIMPTTACNARCTYCFQEGIRYKDMTSGTANRLAEFIKTEGMSGGSITLCWFGGEPLLKPDIIDRICDKLTELNVAFSSQMITNGSLLSEGIIERMIERWKIRQVQISMDGDECSYRSRKRYYRYDDTYKKVMQSIELLSEKGIQVDVRCNVDYENFDSHKRFLLDLSEAVRHKENVWVYFSPLYQVRTSENDLELWTKIRDNADALSADGFNGFVMFTPSGRLRPTRCQAMSGGVVIDPDGELFLCQNCTPESHIGSVYDGITNPENYKNFARCDSIREKCRSCPFLPECTPMSSCPIQDYHCREVQIMMAEYRLNRFFDEQKEIKDEKRFC